MPSRTDQIKETIYIYCISRGFSPVSFTRKRSFSICGEEEGLLELQWMVLCQLERVIIIGVLRHTQQ